MGCCTCINRFLGFLLLIFSVILSIFGIGLVGYGSYLWFQAKTFTIFSGITLGLGGFVTMLSLIMACKGIESPCYCKTYAYLMTVVIFAQGAAVAMYLSPNTRGTLMREFPLNVQHLAEKNITLTSYVLIGLGGIELLSVVLASLRATALGSINEDPEIEGYKQLSSERERRGSSMDLNDPERSAEDRYRSKNAAIYEKYNIL